MSVTNYEVYSVAYNSGDFKACADILYQCILEQEKANNKSESHFDRLRIEGIRNYVESLYNSGLAAPSKEGFYQTLLYISEQLIDGNGNSFPNN